MKDRWEQDLFKMAKREKLVVPETLEDRIDDILVSLPKQNNIFKMTWKKSIILAAALVATLSITVSAAVGAVRARMEAMNEKEMEAYFVQMYTTKVGVDNYNRPYTDSEKSRMKELRASYEEQALFPKGLLTMISEPEEYKGKGVAFYGDTTTFFFPDKEMSDEELLQIIDFMYKRDYSLQAMNEKIAAGEIDFPSQEIAEQKEEEIEATDDSILQSEAVWDPGQELTIPYTGDLQVWYMAAGQNCIFLAGRNAIHTMEIGSGDSTLFFDDFDVETRVTALYQDKKGDVYIALMEKCTENEPYCAIVGDEKFKNSLWILSSDGKIEKKIDLSSYEEEIQGIIRRMVVDDDGYIYLRGRFMKDILMVFDRDGNYVKNITSNLESPYMPHPAAGLGIGKDGKVYTQVETGNEEHMQMGIASVDFEKGTLGDVYMGIVPEKTIMLDIVAPGADTDFVFWGYDGIFTYNLGEESAVNILPAYEAPCEWEGCEYCALPDGRIVFLDCTEYDEEHNPIPEKICLYYKSGLRNP